MVTRNPLAFNSLPKDAAVIPLPKPETTPPVTKTYLTGILFSSQITVQTILYIKEQITVYFFHKKTHYLFYI
jgi:hypothetical protein